MVGTQEATGPGRQGAQQRKKHQGAARDAPHQYGQRRQDYDQERQRSTDRKGPGGGDGRLYPSSGQGIRDAVIRTENRRTQPSDAVCSVILDMPHGLILSSQSLLTA
jgi:hypothetical protein